MIYTNENIKDKLNKRKKRKKIVFYLSVPITLLIVLLCGYICFLKFVKNTDDINIFGYRQYIVLTGSMEPKYNVGDMVFIKKKSENDIKVGDVINYKSSNNSNTVTHRVVEIVKKDGKTFYKTKGDNNSSSDSDLVEYENVQGTIVFKISKIGIILTKLLTGTGLILLFLIIIILYIRSNRIEEKRIVREKARRLYNIPKYEKEDIV